jgi:hypothetical protein
MRDSTKNRLTKLETRASPPEFPRFVVNFVDCRRDPDGTVWHRNDSRYYPHTGVSEELDEPWVVYRYGQP